MEIIMRNLFILLFVFLLFSCKPSIITENSESINEIENLELITEITYINEIEFLKTFSSPMEKYSISSKFGFRKHPMGGEEFDMHKGVDMVGPANSPIFAAQNGKVIIHFPPPNGYFKGHSIYGGLVIIDHGQGIFTLYAHMKSTFVKEGQEVKRGQKIGIQGSTGRSTGPHLHYEVIFDPTLALNH